MDQDNLIPPAKPPQLFPGLMKRYKKIPPYGSDMTVFGKLFPSRAGDRIRTDDILLGGQALYHTRTALKLTQTG